VDLLELEADIKRDIAVIDPTNNFDISEKFDTTVKAYQSKTHIKKMNNDSHAAVLAPFLSMTEAILHHKEENRQQSVGGRTRRAMLQNNDVLTPVDIFYKKCVELLEKVDAAVRKQLEADADGSDKLLKGLPLEASMVGRPFDPSRQPPDQAYRKCPWCDHCCLITAEEDDDATEHNDRKQREWEHKNRIWDAFVQRRTVAVNDGDPPPAFPCNPYDNNKPMRRAPQQPTKKQLKRPRHLCPCVNNGCMMEGSDAGSSCPMKCCKVGEGGDTERYGWIQEGNMRVCQCPLCRCPCNKLFYADDFQRIGLALAMKARQSTNEVPPELQVSQFIGQAITAGYQAVADTESAGRRNQWNLPNNEQYRNDIFYAGAAGNIVRQSGDQLSSSALQLLQDNFGRGTNVTLPGGQSFDTNYITSNPNAHARNNRMTGSLNTTARTAAAAQFPPGMDDRLNIDYTNMNEPYQQAALDPNNLSSSIENVRRGIGNHPTMHTGSNTTASTSSALSASAAAASAAGSNVVTIGASHSGQSDLVMTEEEQETFARHASLEESFAQREDHGGKMSAQQKPALIDLCNDGKTPPPKRIRPTQHPSTMSTMGSYLTASNSNQAGSALLSTFNDVGSQGMQRSASLSAAEVEKIRCNNALTGFSRIEKFNRSFMHNDKDRKSLTNTEKAQRKAAKARKNKITAVKKGGEVDIVDTMGEMVGRNEVTLSQGDNILTPNTAMVRFDRAKSSDSEESSDSGEE